MPQIELGLQLSRLDEGYSIHLFSGKESKLFWFIITRTAKDDWATKESHSHDKAREICESLRSKVLDENLTFDDVWSKCTIYKLTPLEEGVFKHWNYGRLVCIGDAIRKVCLTV
jgi:FAD dependent monooxygenase